MCDISNSKERSILVKKYVVDLSKEEKERLQELTSKEGHHYRRP